MCQVLIREIKPWNNYFVCSDGTFWRDRLLTQPLKANYKKHISKKTQEKNNKKTAKHLWPDHEPYNHVAFNCRKTKIHIIMKRFLNNPVPYGKYRYDRIDHIIPELKCWNAVENLRWSNPHLNSLNRLLLTDIYFDPDIRMWGAEFSTSCRWYKFYHVGFATSFNEIWKMYKQKRIQAYKEWNEFYISNYNKEYGLPQD